MRYSAMLSQSAAQLQWEIQHFRQLIKLLEDSYEMAYNGDVTKEVVMSEQKNI